MDTRKEVLEISWQSIIKFFVVLVGIILLWYFSQIIFAFLTAIIFASVLETPIRWLSKHGLSRVLATILMYLFSIFVVGALICMITPSLIESVANLYQTLPEWLNWDRVTIFLSDLGIQNMQSGNNLLSSLINNWTEVGKQLVKVWGIVSKLFGGVFSGFIILLLAFYINVDKNGIEKFIRFSTPRAYENYAISLWERWQRKIGSWFYSQTILSFIVGGLVFLGLTVLKVKYALLLSLLVAILDFIPYIGSIVAAFCAALISAEGGYITVLLVLLLYTVAQQLEYIISPPIRGRIIKVSPLLIILGVIVGGKLFGVLGVILAIPILALAIELARDIKYGRIVPFLEQERLL